MNEINGMNKNNLISVTPTEGTPVISINGVLFPLGTSTDLSDGNALPSDVYRNKIFYNAEGRQVGTMDDSIVKKPTIEYDSSTATLDISAVITEGKVGPNTKFESSIYVPIYLPNIGNYSITPSVNNTVINKGSYVSGNITILGDPNLKSENIKSGVSIFNVEGSYSPSSEPGGDSANSVTFAKVLKFKERRDAYNALVSIEVSGFGEIDMWGDIMDFSDWNGLYTVTPDTSIYPDDNSRVFKLSNSTNKYLYRMYDYENMEYFWVFDSSLTATEVYSVYFFSETLSTGMWMHYESGSEVSLTLTKESEYVPEDPAVFNVASATIEDNSWIEGSALTLSDFEHAPIRHGIYRYSGSKLLGYPLDYQMNINPNIPLNGLLMYFPMNEGGGDIAVDVINGIKLVTAGRGVQPKDNYWENFSEGSNLIGTNTAFEFPDKFTLSAYVNATNVGSGYNVAPIFSFGECETGAYNKQSFGLVVRTYDDGYIIGYRTKDIHTTYHDGLRIGQDEYTSDSDRKGRRPYNDPCRVTITYDGDGFALYGNGIRAIVNGYNRDDAYSLPDNISKTLIIFSDTNNGGFIGQVSGVMFWDRVLSYDEINSLPLL